MTWWWQVTPWPWWLLNLLFSFVWIAAVGRAWRSADRVIEENRAWTRAWRVLVASLSLPVGINNVFVPFGAVYALMRYKRRARSSPRASIAA